MTVRDLYQEMIIAHNKSPKNFKVPDVVTHVAHGVNPLCGDDFYIYLNVNDDNIIEDIGFQGHGCAISKSSGSLLTKSVLGKSLDDATILKDGFLELLTNDNCSDNTKSSLGNLCIFEGVKEFPIRVKCATLIWRALESAMLNSSTDVVDVSTE